MRIKLMQEGVHNNDWWALSGSIQWAEGQIPLGTEVFITSVTDVIGYVENLRREGDGWITGEVFFHVDTTKEDLKYKVVGMELHPITGHYFKKVFFLEKGLIRAISLTAGLNEGNLFYDGN